MKAIQEVVRNVEAHWVGDGFPVRSLFSYQEGPRFDPFLLLDYAGPHEFAPATAPRGVGEHPHRGFETVTIIYQGELEHRDSAGNHGSIGPGDVQWMTAAGGVVHEEFHSARFSRDGGVLEMVQLWVNLPKSEKMAPPRYQEIAAARIPRVEIAAGAGSVRVIAGQFEQTAGAARTVTPINVWDVRLAAGGESPLRVPEGHTAIVIVQQGAVRLNGQTALRGVELALLERAGETFTLRAGEDARVLILTGQPLEEPIVGMGPFVMNSRDEISQAVEDYHAGRMGHLT